MRVHLQVAPALERAALYGSAEAMLALGLAYADGSVQDPTLMRAGSLLRGAAAHGLSEAQYRLGLFHRTVRAHPPTRVSLGLPSRLCAHRQQPRAACAAAYARIGSGLLANRRYGH
jgi:TPR repeat protein